MSSIVVWLFALSCDGCSCTPGLPDEPAGDTRAREDTEDTADTADTAETGETGPLDTAPPPPCAVPEVEPNDYSSPQELLLEQRACGDFGAQYDFDVFELEVDYGSWISFDIDSQNLGLPTDVALLIADAGGRSAIGVDESTSNDPFLLVPVTETGTWQVVLYENSGTGGEEYQWELMPSISKEPAVWDREEVEDNDSFDDAEEIEAGEVVFGFVESGDVDNYLYVTPEGKHQINVKIEAAELGSPLLSRLLISKATVDEETGEITDWTTIENTYGETNQTFGWDPEISRSSEGGEIWAITVREESVSGSLHWYLLELEAIASETADTGG